MKRRRFLITLSLLPLLVIVGVLSEIKTFSRTSTCGSCGVIRTDEVTRRILCLHQSENSRDPQFKSSPFQTAFPEFTCQHDWQMTYNLKKILWKSPIIVSPSPNDTYGSVPGSTITSAYNHSPEFRTQLTNFLQEGKITRTRIHTLARYRCMDGGLCKLSHRDEFEIQLRMLIIEALP